jgi:subtilisin family serine protease
LNRDSQDLGRYVQSTEARYLPGVVVVKFKSAIRNSLGKTAVDDPSLNFVFKKYSVYETVRIFPQHEQAPASPDEVDLSRIYILRYYGDSDPLEVARDFAREQVVEYAEPHYIHSTMYTPNDPLFAVNQWFLKKIQAEKAWDVAQGDTNTVIGIIDTGVDWTHPDLAPNIWINPRPGGNPKYPNDIRGWDFGGSHGTPDNDPNEDRADHGTSIAGLASCSTNNGIGIAGIGFKCKVMAVKVSQDDQRDDAGPFILYGYEGIVYAVDNGAVIVNCSWGRPYKQSVASRYEQEVINYAYQKGALVVASVGNSNTSTMYTPAAYNHVLSVAATDPADHRSVWSYDLASNYGTWVGVSAPGSGIFSTLKGNAYTYSLNGTSFASALVSGVAGLVKSLHPSWTPDQVAEQIRMSADNIDTLNPGFAGQLGSGRVNAFQAVSARSPGVRIVSYEIDDSQGGNGDSIADAGETVSVAIRFQNFLAPTLNAEAEVTSGDPNVTVLDGSKIILGSLGSLDTVSNRLRPLILKISPLVPENYSIILKVSITDAEYKNVVPFSLPVQPTYKDMDVNNVAMTITSNGSLGFNDFPSNQQGTGFVFRNVFQNLLLEGALMIGVSHDKVSNAARDETGVYPNRHFVTERSLRVKTPGTFADQEGFAVFNDDHAESNRIGIRVSLRSFAFSHPPDDRYVMLQYVLENTTDSTIGNLYAGLFLDWDVDGGSNDIADFDASHRMGYVYDSTKRVRSWAGAALLSSDKIGYRAIDNAGAGAWGIYDGFTIGEKWEALSSGAVSFLRAGPGDVSHVLSTGPLEIASGGRASIGFAVVGGDSLRDLQRSVEAASVKWNNTVNVDETQSSPDEFALYQNYPNPFNPVTNIQYSIADGGYVSLKVYDILGREVATLINEYQGAGIHQATFDYRRSGSARGSLASGVYFYELRVSAQTIDRSHYLRFRDVKKMLVVK